MRRRGTGVKVRCAGRGCPFKRVLRTMSPRVVAERESPPDPAAADPRLEGRLLRPGVTLRLFVTRPDAVGKYTRFRILKAQAAQAHRHVPGARERPPLTCPSR